MPKSRKKKRNRKDHLTAEDKTAYEKLIPKHNLHHLIPTSRIAQREKERGLTRSQYILFPWHKKRHNAWHALFFNMTLREVWRYRRTIHKAIFSSNKKVSAPRWLLFRKKSKNTDNEILSTQLQLSHYQKKWKQCFGSHKLKDAETVMKYMMLFMVFGANMAHAESLLENGTLKKALKGFPRTGYRWWAFQTCFNTNRTTRIRTIKPKLRNILSGYAELQP